MTMTGPLNCVGCKQHRQASKKLDLWNLPEVLVLHLKRFSFTTYSRDKVDEEVIFPLEGLDMSKHMSQARAAAQSVPPVYDLFAVSNHYVCAPHPAAVPTSSAGLATHSPSPCALTFAPTTTTGRHGRRALHSLRAERGALDGVR
jgi:hypothetical protein